MKNPILILLSAILLLTLFAACDNSQPPKETKKPAATVPIVTIEPTPTAEIIGGTTYKPPSAGMLSGDYFRLDVPNGWKVNGNTVVSNDGICSLTIEEAASAEGVDVDSAISQMLVTLQNTANVTDVLIYDDAKINVYVGKSATYTHNGTPTIRYFIVTEKGMFTITHGPVNEGYDDDVTTMLNTFTIIE